MWDEVLLFFVPFRSQFFYAFIVLRWATVAFWASCYIYTPCIIQKAGNFKRHSNELGTLKRTRKYEYVHPSLSLSQIQLMWTAASSALLMFGSYDFVARYFQWYSTVTLTFNLVHDIILVCTGDYNSVNWLVITMHLHWLGRGTTVVHIEAFAPFERRISLHTNKNERNT